MNVVAFVFDSLRLNVELVHFLFKHTKGVSSLVVSSYRILGRKTLDSIAQHCIVASMAFRYSVNPGIMMGR